MIADNMTDQIWIVINDSRFALASFLSVVCERKFALTSLAGYHSHCTNLYNGELLLLLSFIITNIRSLIKCKGLLLL